MNSTESEMQCPQCASVVGPGDLYCSECGSRLDKRISLEDSASIRSLEKENQDLRLELRKVRRRPSKVAGFVLSAFGFIALAVSILYEYNILAFIGLGLTFWGVLLLYIRPTQFIKSQLLESATKTYYVSLKKLLDHLGYEGQPLYLPPRRLEDMKGGVVFISAENDEDAVKAALSEDLSALGFITIDPPGICIVAPGLGLTNLLEEEIGRNFPGVELSYLEQNLPTALTEDLGIAESIEMEVKEGEITVRITNSIYSYLYNEVLDDRLERLGCPLASSIALALARATGRPVTIQEIGTGSESNTITVRYSTLGVY